MFFYKRNRINYRMFKIKYKYNVIMTNDKKIKKLINKYGINKKNKKNKEE